MTTASDLDPTAVLPALTSRRLGRPYELLPCCASTNDEASARAADAAPEGLVVAADRQTGGRGRRGRSWHSPAGENLYCSLLLRPALPAQRFAPMTLVAGAALAETLAALAFRPRLKWPNDLLLETPRGLRKVAGILTEMSSEGDRIRHAVLGVGVNVNSRDFPEALGAIATSLRLVCGRPLDRGRVLTGFLGDLEPIYDDFLANGPGPSLERWRRHAWLGQPCWISHAGGRFDGVAEDVDETGALLVRTKGGELVAVCSGEVHWHNGAAVLPPGHASG